MPTAIRDMLVATTLVAVICLAGCGQNGTVYGVSESNAFWASTTDDPVGGIAAASVSVITLKAGPPEGLPFVVWSDLAYEAAGRGEGSVRGASYEGHHRAKDGRRVDFHAKTTDGKTGRITIAGVDYDLSNGSLFLISTCQEPPTVAQIRFDLSGLQRADAAKGLAESNPRVRDFFEKNRRVNTNGLETGDPLKSD